LYQKLSEIMVAHSSNPLTVNQLLHEADRLQPGEFEKFLVKVLALNTSRNAQGLTPEESELLKKINKEFPTKKMERFLLLDEKCRQESLAPAEHKELLVLIRQLERYDAQKLQLVGQLALLRNVPFDALLKDLGLYPSRHA